jgi:hypothetical protein
MTAEIVDKVDFYSGLAPGDLFSWYTMKGGPAKFAWLVLDVCLPFKSLKDYEVPKANHGCNNDPVIFDEIRRIKLFRTLRTVAPNPLCDPEFLEKEGKDGDEERRDGLLSVLNSSRQIEELYQLPEEILWLVKDPDLGVSKLSSDNAEVSLINDVLENRIWTSLGYHGINRLSARRKFKIGVKEARWHRTVDHGILNWIRYAHHTKTCVGYHSSYWHLSIPFWGCGGTVAGHNDEVKLDTREMTGTYDINKVWRWK